jgi:hypothetical protein
VVVALEPTPEELLGLPVRSASGARIGTVVDVGLFGWREPKFLLVEPEPGAKLLRVEFGEVRDLDAQGITLVAPADPARLPA